MVYSLFGLILLVICFATFVHWNTLRQTKIDEELERKLAEQATAERVRNRILGEIKAFTLTLDVLDYVNVERVKRGVQPLTMEQANSVTAYRKMSSYERLLDETLTHDPYRIESMQDFLINYAPQVPDEGIGGMGNVLYNAMNRISEKNG